MKIVGVTLGTSYNSDEPKDGHLYLRDGIGGSITLPLRGDILERLLGVLKGELPSMYTQVLEAVVQAKAETLAITHEEVK